eukprot:TRINITY_DN21274_c0_g1_i1.p1 TRINITY_DN21274_c0_g1~~TRINITY_DN21274_c0_g1_i1.p1  ORF type:complete len:249 (-),score=23.44 TRINITY_DN21274_c0_g1_i1:88-834(-)
MLGRAGPVTITGYKPVRMQIDRFKFTAPEPRQKKLDLHQKNDAIKKELSYLKLKKVAEKDRQCSDSVLDFQQPTISLDSQLQSMKTKGFMRQYKSYNPPVNLEDQFLSICGDALDRKLGLDTLREVKLDNLEVKFKVLSALGTALNHSVYSSRLADMKTLADVYTFYQNGVSNKNPYEILNKESEEGKLPPNLHIQLDPHRFTGKGDHRLDQVTAYPRSSTLVSGLNTREKYPSNIRDLDPYEEHDYE